MIERVAAGIALVVCIGMLLGTWIGRERLPRWPRLLQRARAAWRWNRQRRNAHREAAEAIERARRGIPPVQRDGNVYRTSFKNRRSNDTHE